jgi:selenide,water dikinase
MMFLIFQKNSAMLTPESKKSTSPNDIKLTQFSHGSGCGCKVAPSVLEEILRSDDVKQVPNPLLLIGNETKDDAAVYDMGNGTGLISTVDFFTPIVDDAFQYGQIAAANALSDVYAMGGKPFLAIAVLGWPVEKLPPALAQRVIAGAKDICQQAGVSLAGGHTIDSPEPFFGLSVNGHVAIHHIKRNSSAQEGDILFLTKPLGIGVLTTALKRGLITAEDMTECIAAMSQLNRIGAELGPLEYVHALTDVTGFGLIGHLIEMCEGSGLSAELYYNEVPLLDHVKELSAKFIYADNTMRNWKSYEAKVEGISGESLLTLCDPQTSGGLLIVVARGKEQELCKLLKEYKLPIAKVGKMIARQSKAIYLK